MIIANAQIAMAASHNYREDYQASEKLDFWLTPKATENITKETKKILTVDDQVNISPQGFSLSELRSRGQSLNLDTKMDARSRVNLMVLKDFYEAITGRRMNIIDPSEIPSDPQVNSPTTQTLQVDATPNRQTPVQAGSSTAGFGLVYQHNHTYREQENMEFKAEGVIHTQDGRQIAFSTSLSMNRNYYEEANINIREGAAKVDPLVINFDGKGAELSQTRFKFDLDTDGSEEQIATLRPGSGFLAFDRNGDGVINDGSELFGPRSGMGFSELAQFDEDGNHFIDEGDSIYNKLRIWTFNEDGSSQLVALGDKQIGAIFLGHVTTPFQLKDERNQSLGEVASSGFYLKETGEVGVVQEINLTV